MGQRPLLAKVEHTQLSSHSRLLVLHGSVQLCCAQTSPHGIVNLRGGLCGAGRAVKSPVLQMIGSVSEWQSDRRAPAGVPLHQELASHGSRRSITPNTPATPPHPTG